MKKTTREVSAKRYSLRQGLILGNSLICALSIGIFTTALIYLTHQQVHRQTDSLLLQLATFDADGMKREFEEGVHVHDSLMLVSSGQNVMATRYTLIFDQDCKILAASSGIEVTHVPFEWCNSSIEPGDYKHFNAEGIVSFTLRATTFAAQFPDDRILVFFVGIDDEIIDASTWQMIYSALPLALLVILSVGFASAFFGRKISRDLLHVSNACQNIEGGQLLSASGQSQALFAVSPGAPREIATLAQTLQDLVHRVEEVLESQSRFLQEAAHELRTPLTSLQGELELSLRRERSRSEYQKTLEFALGDTRRLIELSENLLDAARSRSVTLDLDTISIRKLVKQSLSRRKHQLQEKGVQLVWEGDPDDDFLANAHKLSTSRVIDNLIQNALIHGKPTQLTFRLTQKQISSKEGSFVSLWIIDNGPGIPSKLVAHLFRPFQRHSQTKGYGLGLHLSRLLMQRQGGMLEFVPAPLGEKGARFLLHFQSTSVL